MGKARKRAIQYALVHDKGEDRDEGSHDGKPDSAHSGRANRETNILDKNKKDIANNDFH